MFQTENYNSFGDITSPIVNQSALNKLDPQTGGHPLNFKAYIEGTTEKKYTPSMEKGDLFHAWLANKDNFVFAELDKPAGQMSLFAEFFYELYFREKWKTNEKFLEASKSTFGIDMDSLLGVNRIYQSFYGVEGSTEQIQLLARLILFARKEAEVDKRLLDKTVYDKFEKDCIEYIRFLRDAGDRIIVTRDVKTTLINCSYSVRNNPLVKTILDDTTYRIEKELYWDETWDGIVVKRKGIPDRFKINHENKIITVIDFKTTSYPVSLFPEGAFKKYKLARQLYNYYFGICTMNNLHDYKPNLLNIVVQTNENYPCSVYKVINITSVQEDYSNIMTRLAAHIKSNRWDITVEEMLSGVIYI